MFITWQGIIHTQALWPSPRQVGRQVPLLFVLILSPLSRGRSTMPSPAAMTVRVKNTLKETLM